MMQKISHKQKISCFFLVIQTQRRYNFNRHLNDWRLMRKFVCSWNMLNSMKISSFKVLSKFFKNKSNLQSMRERIRDITKCTCSKIMKQTRTQKKITRYSRYEFIAKLYSDVVSFSEKIKVKKEKKISLKFHVSIYKTSILTRK